MKCTVLCDHTGSKWNDQNIKERFKEKFGSCTGKTTVDLLHKTAILVT